MNPFDVSTVPLKRGITLIEASAGTGKTWSIAALFLRFVIEEHLPVEKILAVTYTVAATQELRERIRKRLRDALAALRGLDAGSDRPPADPVIAAFLENHGDLPRAVRELELAAQSFDEARIFTIHGFCQRALQDHAFESGMRYDAEPLLDPSPLFEEVAHDFWRRTFYDAPPLFTALALARNLSAQPWAALLARTRNHPNVAILPGPEACPAETIAREVAALFEKLRAEWEPARAEVGQLLLHDKGLKRVAGVLREDHLQELLASLDGLLNESDCHDPCCLEALPFLCGSFLAQNLKQGKTAPAHPFFEHCDEFCSAVNRFFNQLVHEFLAYAEVELARRKRQRNVLSFDDLLTQLHGALEGERGDRLAETLGAKYAVALIDEFQDTDPLQSAIFGRLFAGGGHWLFLIGDPKQAIYGFRGADVFTYLKTARSASRQYNLAVNWRSDEPLLAGFNAFFSQSERPFVVPEIEYHPVHAPAGKPAPPPDAGPPLVFRWLPWEDGSPLSKGEATKRIARAVAADIGRLATEGWPMSGMAVLVRNHRQAAEVQATLGERGLKSVLHTEESVFHTDEAEALARLLNAVAEPRNDSRIKAALATRLLGSDAAALAALETDEAAREEWLERFVAWHDLWNNGCFIAMFRRVLVEKKVRERLVQSTGGERRVTNLLHLAELLHQEEAARRLAPEALCGWLREQRFAERSTLETAQLRLESDEEAVAIVTVHKSKGLEYPVVFCPFLWARTDPGRRDALYFHDDDGRITLDMRGREAPPEHLERCREETLAEEARLLYVAVTRARHRCFVYAGEIKESGESALGHLFDSGGLRAGLETLAARHPESVALTFIDPASEACGEARPQAAPLSAAEPRRFDGALQRGAFITSFTGLIAGGSRDAAEHGAPAEVVEVREIEEPSGAAEIPPPVPANPADPAAGADRFDPGIFLFEKGVRAGDFFHDVLEHLDFEDPAGLDTLLPEKLALHGFGNSPFTEALKAKLTEVLEVPLEPGLALRRIAREDRLSEVEFTCKLRSLSANDLNFLFSEHATPAMDPLELGRLRFSPVRGFLRGTIDLLFRHGGRYYVLDWKSNWLGNRPEDYDPPGVEAAMKQHHYALQAHLYVLAADRFLAARLPGYDYERHFGGVFYLFLRGIDRDNPRRAIYRNRPSLALVEALRGLAGETGETEPTGLSHG